MPIRIVPELPPAISLQVSHPNPVDATTTRESANGALSSTSHGVVGLQGMALNAAAAGNAQGSVISSADRNVKLDSGTQMVLQITGSAAAQ